MYFEEAGWLRMLVGLGLLYITQSKEIAADKATSAPEFYAIKDFFIELCLIMEKSRDEKNLNLHSVYGEGYRRMGVPHQFRIAISFLVISSIVFLFCIFSISRQIKEAKEIYFVPLSTYAANYSLSDKLRESGIKMPEEKQKDVPGDSIQMNPGKSDVGIFPKKSPMETSLSTECKSSIRDLPIPEEFLYFYLFFVRKDNDTFPCIDKDLTEIAGIRVDKIMNEDDEVKEDFRSSTLMEQRNITFTSLTEIVVITTCTRDNIVQNLAGNEIRTEMFKRYKFYGANFTAPFLVEIWANSDDMICKPDPYVYYPVEQKAIAQEENAD